MIAVFTLWRKPNYFSTLGNVGAYAGVIIFSICTVSFTTLHQSARPGPWILDDSDC